MSAAEFRARQCGAKVPANKYHVSAKEDRTADGITFASKAEMRRYLELLDLQKTGAVAFFFRQVPIALPGKTKYLADFVSFWPVEFGTRKPKALRSYMVRFEDVKGCRTEIYRLKKRQVEALYPIEIEER